MTTPSASSNDQKLEAKPKRNEAAAECEAGLRRVLAYICAQRHRRLIAFTAVFLLLFSVVQMPVSILVSILYPIVFAALGKFAPNDIFSSPTIFGLVSAMVNLILPLIITLLIFMQIRKIYRNDIPTE